VYATARNASQLEELVAAHNGKVIAVGLDVTDLDAVQASGTNCHDVTLVVNNTGFNSGRPRKVLLLATLPCSRRKWPSTT
jgi:NADP-dependent 3-hydroxy acid dehydrogenase YdfG